MVKRIVAILLVLALSAALLPAVAVKAEAAGKMTIEQLQAKFPNGKYWNGGNPNSYTSTPCTHHSGGCTYSGSCGCNTFFGLSIQCMGYAEKLGYDFTGYNPRNNSNGWKTYTSASAIDSLKPGDIVHYGTGNNHSIFVTSVNGDTVTFTDCNYKGTCRIRWGATISKKTLKEKIYHVRSAPYAISTVNVLSVKYNANGGTILNSDVTGYQYKVTSSDGLNMRSGAGLGYALVTALKKDTEFTVNVGNTKTADGYTWGKTTVSGKTGWVVISQYVKKVATLRATDFYLDSSQVCQTSSSSVLVHNMTYGTSYPNGLWDAASFGLTREGYTFLGWSMATSGAEVIDQKRVLKPEEIVPELKNGSKSVVLYAIWKENVPANLTFQYDANGAEGEMETVSALNGDTLTLSGNQFVKENHSFVGWTVQRQDGLYYTEKGTWDTETNITAQAISKKILTDGAELTLDSAFVTMTGDHSYTLCAQWKDETIRNIRISSIGKDNLYYVGDSLNTSDMRIMVEHVDGTCETVTEGFTCSPMTLTKEGTQTVTVTYDSFTAEYQVQVTAVKVWKENAKSNAQATCYLLPSTSAKTFYYTFSSDELTILCKDGNFYLGFYPWQVTTITEANGVLAYIPASSVTLNSGVTIPSAADYYTINCNATVNSSAKVYHRTNTSSAITKNNTDETVAGTLSAGATVKVLFEMNGYYCIRTATYTGFVAKSAITLNKVLCGIQTEGVECLKAEVDGVADTSLLTVKAIYSDGTSEAVGDYTLTLPDTSKAGMKCAVIAYSGFSTFVPVQISNPVVTAVTVYSEPNQRKYITNSKFDPTGLSLSVTYENGRTEIVSQGYIVGSYDFSVTGYVSVPVSYKGYRLYVPVLVYDAPGLQVVDSQGYYDQTVNVPVVYNCSTQELSCYGISAALTYDAEVLQYRGFIASDSIDATKLVIDATNENIIVIEYAGDEELPKDYVILELQFKLIGAKDEEYSSQIVVDELAVYDHQGRACEIQKQSGTVTSLGLVYISFVAEDATNVPEEVQAVYGQQVTIAMEAPVRNGYSFIGWATWAGADSAEYQCGDVIDCTESVTLYAVWKQRGVVVCKNGASDESYDTLNEALENYDPSCQYIKLTEDLAETATLTKDLYIDLNGFDFTGTIDTAGYSIYGMDSSTDGYSCDNIGYFNCVDPQGNAVVPVSNVKTELSGSVKRYLTIDTQQGYTFHRYYMGVTHMSVRSEKQGVGYKAVFAGDPMVLEKVDGFGYSLQLGTFAPHAVNCDGSKLVSGKMISLRVDGFDVERFGQTDLTAQVFLTVNGETIYSSAYTTTLKDMVQAVDENIAAYTDAQITALQSWLSAYEITKSWELNNL